MKKEYHQNKLKQEEEKKQQSKIDTEKETMKNTTFKEYEDEVDVYKSKQKSLPKKSNLDGKPVKKSIN